jgi:hypothetical protein
MLIFGTLERSNLKYVRAEYIWTRYFGILVYQVLDHNWNDTRKKYG